MAWRYLVWTAAAALLLPACVLDRAGFSSGDGAGGAGASIASSGAGVTTDGSGGAGTSGTGSGASAGSGASGGGTPMCPTGYECVPAITAGRFVRTPTGSDTCGGAWAIAVDYAAPTDPGCNACTCGAPEGGSCSIHIKGYQFGNCSVQLGYADAAEDGCFDLFNTISAYRLEPPVAQGGSCVPAGGGPVPLNTKPACGTAETIDMTCGTGMVCVPEGSGQLCNAVGEAESCSTGYQDALETIAAVQGDTRQCTCDCGPPDATCNGASAQVFNNNDCTALLGSVPPTDQCTNLTNTNGSFYLSPGTWSAPSCPANTNPGGNVMFGANEKLCCLASN